MGTDRFIVESEGDWTCRVNDNHTGQYILRTAPPSHAHVLAWGLNNLTKGLHLVAVHSRFQVIMVSEALGADFYEGPR